MSNLMGALTRLERAGSDSSRVTKKLHEAAATIASKICDSVRIGNAIGEDLPRGYSVTRCRSNIGSEVYLTLTIRDEYDYRVWIDGTGGYLHGDFNCPIPEQTREGSLRFAEDVASGLLDEIATFLEERQSKDEKAASVLEAAV